MGVLKKIKNMMTSHSSRSIRNKPKLSSPTVYNAFRLKYPNASTVQWQQIDVFRWEVNFILRNKWYSALFDSHGNWLETMTLISLEAIPKNVRKIFKKSFAISGIKNIRKIEMANGTIYEIKWTNGVFIWNLLYDISGKMVGKVIA
jgi:hypothetical protein